MKKIAFLLIAIVAFGCTPRTESSAIIDGTKTDLFSHELEVSKDVVIEITQELQQEWEIVFLPFEVAINEYTLIIIRENGKIEFGDNVFVFKEAGEKFPLLFETGITTFKRNNLFAINITEETGWGLRDYTFIFNIETRENISFEIVECFFRFWGFFAIENMLILTSNENAYGFDDSTGELLWTQSYSQRDGRRIIFNDDRIIIDDNDGNMYMIFGDGRKEKMLH